MVKLLFVPDIQARYNCSPATARKKIRQMYHLEEPLAAPEWAVEAYERERLVAPADQEVKKPARRPKPGLVAEIHIPRRREA